MSSASNLNDDLKALQHLLETLGAPCNTTTDCIAPYLMNQTKFDLYWDCTNKNEDNSSTINNICVLDSCSNSTECAGSNDICWNIVHCDEENTNTINNKDEDQLFSTLCLPYYTCSNISNIKQDNNDMVCDSLIFISIIII